MCGLVGIFDTRGAGEISSRLLHDMNEAQFHRGPDEGGVHIEPGIGLGHRRLSIIDLSSGQQPMFNEDDSVVVVFNGEIYNFAATAQELKDRGHRFHTHCDTEVIVHAWEEWGVDCLSRFRGMFAFAVWDRNKKTLFLARDRLGIKPLHYGLMPDGRFIFGSEMKTLYRYPGLDRGIDPKAVEEYFAYGYVPEPRTIYKSLRKLEPGHYLLMKQGEPVPSPRQYWDVPFDTAVSGSEREIEEELIARIKEATDLRLVSEVPLGAFLSGGVDSSAIVAMMAQLMDEPVNTCSISFSDPKYNETEFAQQVADRYRTNHFVGNVDSDDFDLIDRLAFFYDEPYADSSAIPTYRVCELAKKRVTVVLSGDGGDENLAGYRRYRWHMYESRMRGMIPERIRQPVFGLLGRLYPKADWAPKIFRAKTTFESIARDDVAGYLHSVSHCSDAMRERLFSRSFKAELQGYRAVEVLRRHARNAPEHPLSRVQYLDLKTYLVGDILTKVDRASMAHALEVRVPLLDHKLVEWVSGIDPDLKLRGHEGKYVLKKALEPYLPHDVLYRHKMGFAVPLTEWFRGPLRQKIRDALLGDTLAETGIFDPAYLKYLVDAHQSGARDHTAPLWSLLMFESFQRQIANA